MVVVVVLRHLYIYSSLKIIDWHQWLLVEVVTCYVAIRVDLTSIHFCLPRCIFSSKYNYHQSLGICLRVQPYSMSVVRL